MSELNYDPSDPDKMQLPAGKTCGDCGHIRRCKAIFRSCRNGHLLRLVTVARGVRG